MYDKCIATYCTICQRERPEGATGATVGCGDCRPQETKNHEPDYVRKYCCECGVPETYLRLHGPKYIDLVRGDGSWWCRCCVDSENPDCDILYKGHNADYRKRHCMRVEMRSEHELSKREKLCNEMFPFPIFPQGKEGKPGKAARCEAQSGPGESKTEGHRLKSMKGWESEGGRWIPRSSTEQSRGDKESKCRRRDEKRKQSGEGSRPNEEQEEVQKVQRRYRRVADRIKTLNKVLANPTAARDPLEANELTDGSSSSDAAPEGTDDEGEQEAAAENRGCDFTDNEETAGDKEHKQRGPEELTPQMTSEITQACRELKKMPDALEHLARNLQKLRISSEKEEISKMITEQLRGPT